MIAAEEFDRRANLPPEDPAGDLEPYLDQDKAMRPGRAVQRVNVDFPTAMLRVIDREATRLGVTRQAFIKIRLADTLPTAAEALARGQQQIDEAFAQLATVETKHARHATNAEVTTATKRMMAKHGKALAKLAKR